MGQSQDDMTDDQEMVFDWKKKGIGQKEVLTLQHNPLEAEAYNARKKNQTRPSYKPKPDKLPAGLKKLRQKVREVYDDEDEEENETIFATIPVFQEPENNENALLNALTEDEKRMIMQKDTIENTRMQQNAGKMEALHVANNLAREAGLSRISRKAMEVGMQEAVFNPEKMQEKTIKKEVSNKLGIKGSIRDGKIIEAARGIKKVENIGGKEAAKNLDMRDIVKAGEEKLSDIKLAEKILEKSGQDVKKRKLMLKKGKEKIELKNFEQNNEKDHLEKKNNATKKKLDISR